ncbi:MAG: polyprenyl synthetase family protein [Desulfurococcales archaeon]|jgi:geranylgeranyl diphosphate synthase type I|nr:polyprenyl synthetase family protein [Desulfurococcales archaeon]NAZ14429.1 polyprenyl synthetase family protein [Desulfurococcales archaeon]
MNLDEFAKDFLPRVERYIDQIIRTDIDHLEKASKHLIKAGGKRLRPLMLGLFTKAFDGDLENAAIAGAAVEILHNFTLVHDDIMDRDQFRRGVPTTHVVFGEPMAILAGDYLYAKAYRALLWLKDRVDDHKLVKIIDLLNKASEIVAEGQALDLTLPSYHEVSEEQYIDMIYRKTSSLFMAAAGIGVMLGRSSEQDVEKAIEYARYAGIAFQIRDDILGLLGDPSVTGKPVLNDLREGKRTILVIHAFKEASDFDKNEMLRIIGNKEASIKDLEKAKDLVIKYGGVKKAEDLAKSYLEKALKVLDEIERRALNKDSIYIIKDLTTRLVYREK